MCVCVIEGYRWGRFQKWNYDHVISLLKYFSDISGSYLVKCHIVILSKRLCLLAPQFFHLSFLVLLSSLCSLLCSQHELLSLLKHHMLYVIIGSENIPFLQEHLFFMPLPSCGQQLPLSLRAHLKYHSLKEVFLNTLVGPSLPQWIRKTAFLIVSQVFLMYSEVWGSLS